MPEEELDKKIISWISWRQENIRNCCGVTHPCQQCLEWHKEIALYRLKIKEKNYGR